MYAQIRQHAHGRQLSVKKPGAGAGIRAPCFRAAVSKPGTERQRPADFPGVDPLPGLLMGRGQPLVLVDHQQLSGLSGRPRHGLAVLQRGRHGLFAQHVLPGLQRRDGHFCVAVVGGADADRVDGRVGQQLHSGGIGLRAVAAGQLPGSFFVQIGQRGNLYVRVCRIFRKMTHLRDLPAANDPNAKHGSSSSHVERFNSQLLFSAAARPRSR